MKFILGFALGAFVATIGVYELLSRAERGLGYVKEKVVAYDCQLAEISPDIPKDYKKACREARK